MPGMDRLGNLWSSQTSTFWAQLNLPTKTLSEYFGASVRRSSSRRLGGRLLAMTQWPDFFYKNEVYKNGYTQIVKKN